MDDLFPLPYDERYERDPLYWRHEFVIRNVLAMYEWGRITSFTVDQRQGERPRLSWTVKKP
jgi:hypothetical protein